jgi:hypothetical protein
MSPELAAYLRGVDRFEKAFHDQLAKRLTAKAARLRQKEDTNESSACDARQSQAERGNT